MAQHFNKQLGCNNVIVLYVQIHRYHILPLFVIWIIPISLNRLIHRDPSLTCIEHYWNWQMHDYECNTAVFDVPTHAVESD